MLKHTKRQVNNQSFLQHALFCHVYYRSLYFISVPRKTWQLINELQSRQCKSNKVSQIKSENQVLTSSDDIAEASNNQDWPVLSS